MRRTIEILMLVAALASCRGRADVADAYGNIEVDDITLSSEVSGKLLCVAFNEGDLVPINHEVALVDTIQQELKIGQLRAQVQVASAKMEGINAQVAIYDEQIRTIQVELRRVQQLHADSAATQRQLDEVQGRFNIAIIQKKSVEVQRQAVNAELVAIEAQVAQVRDLIRRCHVVAPVQGYVLAKFVQQGELVAQGSPICRIAKLDTVLARVYIDETQLSTFKLGGKVRVHIDGVGGELIEHEGVVAWISTQAEFTPKIIQTRNERANLVYAVKVRVPNTGGVFKIGMPVEVRINNS